MSETVDQPYVLIVEGLISPPIAYRRMRQRLLDQGAAGVDLAPVHVHDWMWAGVAGFGRLQRQVAHALRRAHGRAEGKPIMVIGHSGGGLLARLAMYDGPYRGHVEHVADVVGCLVTLGTPHDLHHMDTRWRHQGVQLSQFLAEQSPGARYAPHTAYLTVGSDAVRPAPAAQPRRRRNPMRGGRDWFFQSLVGTPRPNGSDGMVSLDVVHLDGACQVTYHDVHHGVVGTPWYGDTHVVERWWPLALDAWRTASLARATEPADHDPAPVTGGPTY
ncbi:MAG: hypothetical protein LH650_10545 [Chloroflexi bacterium]|nr:hypothetical protein [Chloroflexota bacterium]